MAKEHAKTAHSAASEDLKKKRVPSGVESVNSVSNTSATFVGRSAGSRAKAQQVFRTRLEQESKPRVGFTHAWMTSVLEAYADFFAQMAETSRQLFEESRKASKPGIDAGVAIDYERLARLVANELRKQKIDDETA